MRGPCAEWGSSAVFGGVLTVFTRDDPSMGLWMVQIMLIILRSRISVGLSSVQLRKE
jgi:hypothetical protein